MAIDFEEVRRRVEVALSQSLEPGLNLLGTRLKVHGLSTVELTIVLRGPSGEIHVLQEDLTDLIEQMQFSEAAPLADLVVSHAENVQSMRPWGQGETVLHWWR
jgi:hypothetical protein